MQSKIKSIVQLYEFLPEKERIILDILRQIVLSELPPHFKEKISFNVPYFYGKKGVCIIWPASVPRGGIKQGVLFGFWYGNKLHDYKKYLDHGKNKQIYYKIFKELDEINENQLTQLLKEAIIIDQNW